jgi:hypothetical protein
MRAKPWTYPYGHPGTGGRRSPQPPRSLPSGAMYGAAERRMHLFASSPGGYLNPQDVHHFCGLTYREIAVARSKAASRSSASARGSGSKGRGPRRVLHSFHNLATSNRRDFS